jgi:arginyl-tRNA--protein-N-Asp/Glu arginylyltransferase
LNKLINKFNHNFYLSNTETCSYLDNKQERKIFTIMDNPGQTYEYESLIKLGFRRSHNILYNQVCDSCNLCKSIRISCLNFKPSKSEKRVLKKNCNVFQKNLKAPKIFWKTNLEVSLKHKLFTSNSSEVVSCRKYVMTTDHLLYNQYYLPLFVANISLHKKLYRTFFITYFMYILTVWPKLNKHFNLILQFYLVSSNFLLVGYYNKYFFKIYNF